MPSNHTRSRRRATVLLTLVLAVVGFTACVNIFWKSEPRDLGTIGSIDSTMTITTPIKAHLRSGETVVFAKGGVVTIRQVTGVAQRFPVVGTTATTAAVEMTVPLDSVVGFETFDGKIQPAPTALVSIAATVAGVFGTGLLAIAIFGSCPTLYADSGSSAVLQAEGFSYAIAPLFRQRDIDPLTVARTHDGIVRLELRNEALETHYIDHLELTRVTHGPAELVVPDQQGRVVALSKLRFPRTAVDRDGRDVRALVRDADDRLFATAQERLARAHAGDLDDWIDIDGRTDGTGGQGDSVAIVLRLRNSLLNTLLLYEGMLSGPEAPDWLARQMQQPAEALALARWYRQRMGMRISVDGGPVDARIGDVGPLAFREVAVVVPRPRDDGDGQVRLRFVADNWRIDQIRIADVVRRTGGERVPVGSVVAPVGQGAFARDTAAMRLLSAADERYLETRPGQRMVLEFSDRQPVPTDSAVRYLVTWQGWYNEWIRPSWITAREPGRRFVPHDSALAIALSRWRSRKPAFEAQFYSTRIPTR
jgi:hypothetical protein